MLSYALTSVFVFVFGTILGSFFNVCIFRLPREESVVNPPSHCPACGAPISWYDNIPVISFFMLGRKCRACLAPIRPRYVVIELLTGAVFVWLWLTYGLSVRGVAGAFLFSCLLIASVVDLEFQIIPDEVSLGGLAAGLLFSTVFPSIHGEILWWRGLLLSLLGVVAGGGLIYLTGVIGDFVFKKESMGGGDVKLLGMIGSILGWQNVLLVFFLAPVLALPLGLFMKFVRRAEVIPFGPFLSLAAWMAFLWGDKMIIWYLNGMGM